MAKKLSTLLLISLLLFITEQTFAQYVVKPAAIDYSEKDNAKPSVKQGKEYDVIWSETFNGELPAGWENINVNGFCSFQHTYEGPQGPYSNGIPAINSTTAANGFMILDADYCNEQSGEPEYEVVDAYIQSPAIDLSANSSVGLRFEHFYRYCCDPELIEQKVLVSNNGENWVEFDVTHDLAPNNLSENPQITILNISAVAGESETVWLRFQKKGAIQYFWMIDDVSIISLTENDLELTEIRHDGYSIIPGGINSEINFSGNVKNIGATPQHDVELSVNVNSYLYSESSETIPSLNPSSEVLLSPAIPFDIPGKGIYEIDFSASQLETDEFPENNIKEALINVSDSVYARDKGIYSASELVWPAQLDISSTGNIFNVQTNAIATSMSVALHENTEVGQSVSAVVYEVPLEGDFVEIGRSDPVIIEAENINSENGEAIWLNIALNNIDLLAGNNYLAAIEYNSNNVAIAADNFVWQPVGAAYSMVADEWLLETANPMIRLNLGQNIADCNIIAHFDVVDDFCNMGNGSITAYPVSGIPPYTYEWDTDPISEEAEITNLSAGIYTVIITDDESCSDEFVIEIENKEMEYEVEVIPAACSSNTGIAIVSPLSGQAPFSYSWDHDAELLDSIATGMEPGLYSMTITDANGCDMIVELEVTSIEELTLDKEIVQPTCLDNNGSIEIIPLTGEGPYAYEWSNDAEFTESLQENLAAGLYTVTVTDVNDCVGTIEVDLTADDIEIIVLGDVIHSTCEQPNGAVHLNVTNGDAPYEYLWSNESTEEDLTGVYPGTYSVVVTDAHGCTGDASFEIDNSGEAPEVTIDVTNASACGEEDGTIEVTPVDPEADYSYLWGGGETGPILTGLGSGIYYLTVTDNSGGCYADFEVFVNDDGLPDMTIVQNNVSCYGYDDGSISIDIPGGGFDFMWSTGSEENYIDNLEPGDYDVVISNVDCFAHLEFTIVEPDLLEVESISVVEPNCYDYSDGEIEVIAVGGTAPYQYMWNDQIPGSHLENLTAGDYHVVVTDVNNCEAERSYVLSNPEEIVIIAQVVNPDPGENNGSIEVTVLGAVGEVTYEWDSEHTGSHITGLGPGTYTVTVTDENGCTAVESFELFLTSIHEPDFAENISVYPNPAKEILNIEIGELKAYQWDIKLFDMLGTEIKSLSSVSNNSSISIYINDVSKGAYVLQITSEIGRYEQVIIVN